MEGRGGPLWRDIGLHHLCLLPVRSLLRARLSKPQNKGTNHEILHSAYFDLYHARRLNANDE